MGKPGRSQSIQWEHNGTIISENNELEIDKRTGHLRIKMKNGLNGEWFCIDTTDEDNLKISERILVESAYLNEFTSQLAESREYTTSENVELGCSIEGVPEPEVIWHRKSNRKHKNDIKIKNGEKIKIEENYDPIKNVKISNITMHPYVVKGDYYCSATNIAVNSKRPRISKMMNWKINQPPLLNTLSC